ncbi:MAG: hypothetical protein GYA21_17575 [Myxococcales bacterium]|nr:hypothetical protein [Myxococcales bacterium]
MPVSEQQAVAALEAVLKPGDVINIDSRARWYKFWYRIPYALIRSHQKRIFGEWSRWRDTHTMLYLGPQFGAHSTFSVEPPTARYLPLSDFCFSHLSIYRHRTFVVGPAEALIMDQACHPLAGTVYDVGQLLDIMVNRILGYPQVVHYRCFDFSRRCKVCSVGARIAYEHLRHVLEGQGNTSLAKLFSTVRPQGTPVGSGVIRWGPDGPPPSQFGSGVDVEATAPAHFANSEYFGDEFVKAAEFDYGVPV